MRFLTWSKGTQAIRAHAGHANALTDEEIAASDMGGDDLIAVDPGDWPKLRVLLEVFFRVGEDEGLDEAARWLTRRAVCWSWATPAPQLPS